MGIVIRLFDETTDSLLEDFIISDTDEKVLSTDMRPHDADLGSQVVFITWLKNAIFEKVRHERDFLVEKALGEGHEKIQPLIDTDKQVVRDMLNVAGYVLSPPIERMPSTIKDKIIELAIIKTAAQREAEFKAGS